MFLQASMRTDIPAYFSEWFMNRLREGFVLVRNPYNPQQVMRYRISPEIVDVINFCTKNPEPMLCNMDYLEAYGMYWSVTITPYGADVEPNVPPVSEVVDSFRHLSDIVGKRAVGWRYDPIIINERYTADFHLRTFRQLAAQLSGYTDDIVISFVDLYAKVRRNYKSARAASESVIIELGERLAAIAVEYGMTLRPCGAARNLNITGADSGGCMSLSIYEKAIGKNICVPPRFNTRVRDCACLLSGDIGAYNSCEHLCRYCYANTDSERVVYNRRMHNPDSPFIIGSSRPDDILKEAEQESWISPQRTLFDYSEVSLCR